jgi:sensor c-di-GMP phosphodiesterase-like protein
LLVHKGNEIIAGDIISMMYKLGHTVVAEGVECEEQKEYSENFEQAKKSFSFN